MVYLSETADVSMGNLALVLGRTPSTCTTLVDVLEGAGIVVRSRSGADRRSIAVALTPRGRALAGVLWPRESASAGNVGGNASNSVR